MQQLAVMLHTVQTLRGEFILKAFGARIAYKLVYEFEEQCWKKEVLLRTVQLLVCYVWEQCILKVLELEEDFSWFCIIKQLENPR